MRKGHTACHKKNIQGVVEKYTDFSCCYMYLHIVCMSKNYILFIACTSSCFFLKMRSVSTLSFEHLINGRYLGNHGLYKLDQQRSVIKWPIFVGQYPLYTASSTAELYNSFNRRLLVYPSYSPDIASYTYLFLLLWAVVLRPQ